ncbi:MAG: hypothetical protein CM1200mP28_13550 [Deltaproteobacteria bacterium]|nr:MAG: hypothetical protein CM1200mP28_13550 [Deltaproteobacteria bacterium]
MFLETSRDKGVVLHRVNPQRRKAEPLFEKLKLLPLDYPIADACFWKIGAINLNQVKLILMIGKSPLCKT